MEYFPTHFKRLVLKKKKQEVSITLTPEPDKNMTKTFFFKLQAQHPIPHSLRYKKKPLHK